MVKHVKVPAVHGLAGEPIVGATRTLAKAIGFHEAVFLQRVYFWIALNEERHQNQYEGRSWMYNTYAQWEADFPFWSNATIRRIVDNLRSSGLLITSKLGRDNRDHTLWYTIDFGALQTLLDGAEAASLSIHEDPAQTIGIQGEVINLSKSSAQGEQTPQLIKLSKSSNVAVKTAEKTYRTTSPKGEENMGELDDYLTGQRETVGKKKPSVSKTVTSLSHLWKKLCHQELGIFQPALSLKDQAYLRAMMTQAGGYDVVADILRWVVPNWLQFIEGVKVASGQTQKPAAPTLGYLVTHWTVAAQLMATQLTPEPVATVTPKLATLKPVEETKATIEEVLAAMQDKGVED